MEKSRQQTPLRRGLKNLLLVCLSAFITVVALELILSRFTRLGQDESKIDIRLTKEKGRTCYPSDPLGILPVKIADPSTHQPLHCVSYDYDQRRNGFFPDRNKQVAIVGDSFAFGEGLMDKDTPGYLLGQRFSEYNFRNYGVPGTDIAYAYSKTDAIIKGVKNVKAIIYFYNLNDVLAEKEFQTDGSTLFDMQNIRWQVLPPGGLIEFLLPNCKFTDVFVKEKLNKSDGFLHNSIIYRLIRKAAILHAVSRRTVQNCNNIYFSSRNRTLCRRSIAYLIAMDNLAKRNKVKFYVVIYPLFYKDILGRYPFTNIHNFMIRICNRFQIVCFDAYEPFKNQYSLKRFIVHPVDYHPNGRANALVVDFLARRPDFLPAGDQ